MAISAILPDINAGPTLRKENPESAVSKAFPLSSVCPKETDVRDIRHAQIR